MPKSKRAKVFHLTQVSKKTREHKEKLFEKIRECIPQYQHCFVFSVENMRNNHLKDVRRELDDCRLFFGKTKLAARALGTTPSDAQAPGLDLLAAHLRGSVGLLFTNRRPAALLSYLGAAVPTASDDHDDDDDEYPVSSSVARVDFARAGAVAPRAFVVPPGVVHSTGGAVPAADDVPLAYTQEPELRRLGMPVRMVKGKVVLPEAMVDDDEEVGAAAASGGGYVVCREGDVLDSRQTRLLKLFGVCMSEFRVRVLAYWSAADGSVTEVDPVREGEGKGKGKGEGMEEEEEAEEEE